MKSFLVRADSDADNAIQDIQNNDPEWKTLVEHIAGELRKYMLKADPTVAGDIDFESGLCAALLDDVLEDIFPGYKEGQS